MRGSEFLDKLEYIDDDLIEAAGAEPEVKREKVFKSKKEAAWRKNVNRKKEAEEKRVVKWKNPNRLVAAAAGLCLVLAGAYAALLHGNIGSNHGSHTIQQWSATLAAKDYFKYNEASNAGNISDINSVADCEVPYAATRYFSDERELLENENVIPVIESHPLFHCVANYNEDGSLFSLIFSWQNRDDKDSYSDLTITAGYQEVELIDDCIEVEIDKNGNIAEPAVTVTVRDGIQIVAKGGKHQNKTLTFQNDTGWYQIEASWNDDYDDMVMLLDWLWEHPVDFERFPMDAGDNYTYTTREEYPSAFAAYIPDFEELGYPRKNAEILTFKNGEPYSFEGQYEADGKASVWWCVDTEPDYYEQQEIMGDLDSLTLQKITDVREDEQHITFMWDDYCIKVYIGSDGTAEDIWKIIEAIR